MTTLFDAAENDDTAQIDALLASGADVEAVDSYDRSPLVCAVQCGSLNALRALLNGGADPLRRDRYEQTPLASADSREVIELLVAYGADLGDLPSGGRRAYFGHGAEDDPPNVCGVDPREALGRVFGRANPQRMNSPFREAMIRSRVSGYTARTAVGRPNDSMPTWCFRRFGQSLTKLPDGRYVEVAGEHEDFYDPDFCIYNDVVVHHPDGAIDLFGYPEADFPPTDFHTATLLGDTIYLIGCLGYAARRLAGFTPVYSLNTSTFAIEELRTQGNMPGWIYRHRARALDVENIEITQGTILLDGNSAANDRAFRLHIPSRIWSIVPA